MNFWTIFYTFTFLVLPIVYFYRKRESKKWKKRGNRKPSKKKERKYFEEDKPMREYVRGLKDSDDYNETSDQLREIIKRRFFSYSELQGDPQKFFRYHELIAEEGPTLVSLGIKLTVQFNLYSGSVFFLGDESQVKELVDSQEEGKLGCFALTEKNAGVVSGMIVETKMTFDKEEKCFIVETPKISLKDGEIVDFDNTGACKTWISQAMTADYMVLFGELITEGDNKGIHAFFLNMEKLKVVKYDSSVKRDKIEPDTVYMELQEGKGSFNGLDNAKIIFNKVKIPVDSLLSKYCVVDPNSGQYSTRGGLDKFNFLVIAQRLLTGRAVIGNTSLIYFKSYLKTVKENVLDVRQIPVGSVDKTIPLREIPHIRDFVYSLENKLEEFEFYMNSVISELCVVLKNGKRVDDHLVERISISKILCTNWCIEKIFQLKTMIGSEALFTKNQLCSNLDVFYCCSFAEGDNRILQQKITRDHLYHDLKKKKLGAGKMLFKYVSNGINKRLWWWVFSSYNRKRTIQRLQFTLENKLFDLGYIMSQFGRKDRDRKIARWMKEYEKVYEISDIVCEIELLKAIREGKTEY